MYVVGADAMVLVEGVARPFGPEHAVDARQRILCRETRARFVFPSITWAAADSTICPDCLDVVTTPGFEDEEGEAPAIEAAEIESDGVEAVEPEIVEVAAEVHAEAPAEDPALVPVAVKAAEATADGTPLSPALQQLYASPLWKSYVKQLEETAGSESNV